MTIVLIWEGIEASGKTATGIIEGKTRAKALQSLKKVGYMRLRFERISPADMTSPLSAKEIIVFLGPLISMLEAGISIKDTFQLLIEEKSPKRITYVYLVLRNALNQGESLASAFDALRPLFSQFFVSMIHASEQSGNLKSGLGSLGLFHKAKDERNQAVEKLVRYPKIVIGMAFLVLAIVLMFIIPMFSSVYSLFGDELPMITQWMVTLSSIVTWNQWITLVVFALVLIAFRTERLARFNPFFFLVRKMRTILESGTDFFLYAHAMKILLQSGLSINASTEHAAECMSVKNQKYGRDLLSLLVSGYSFTRAFSEIPWFPKIFVNILSTAEKTGNLVIGFDQIHQSLSRKRDDDFVKWSRFIEPVLMTLLGAMVLTILLAIYLPIFDLGNRIG